MSDLKRRDPVEVRRAEVTDVDFEHRTITTIAVPYNEEALVIYRGQDLRESFDPAAFHGIETRNEDVTVNRDHDPGRTVGIVKSYRSDDPIGLVAESYISNTALGNETLQLAADGILKASVGFSVRPSDQVIRQGVRRIKRAFLDHLALLPNPAYKGARVLAVRQESEPPAVDVGLLHTPNLDEILELFADRF